MALPFPSLELFLQQLPELTSPGKGSGGVWWRTWSRACRKAGHQGHSSGPSGGNGGRVAARAGGPPAPRGQRSSLGLLAWVSLGKGGDRALAFQLEPHRPASFREVPRSGRTRTKQGLHLSQPSGRQTEPHHGVPKTQANPHNFSCLPGFHLLQGTLCSQRAQCHALRCCLLFQTHCCPGPLYSGISQHAPLLSLRSIHSSKSTPLIAFQLLLQVVRTSSTLYFMAVLFVSN